MRDPVFIGMDPAKPGGDETVLAINGSMSTAIEVEHRLREYNARMGNVHDRMRQFSNVVLELMMDTKVPLIRRFRRKRKYRRLIPRMPQVVINLR